MKRTIKLLRTIALDPSDTFVFDVPATPGEWAVSGAFRFCDQDPAKLSGKARVGPSATAFWACNPGDGRRWLRSFRRLRTIARC
ncbi:hypothetical protein ACVWW4_000423 [Bradyrhizobium sp. LB7.1]